MGMGDRVLTIEKLENGYEVEVCDQKIMEANNKPKSNYQDPWKGYAFTTGDEVVAFIKAHIDSLKPPPDADKEYATSFAAAAEDD